MHVPASSLATASPGEHAIEFRDTLGGLLAARLPLVLDRPGWAQEPEALLDDLRFGVLCPAEFAPERDIEEIGDIRRFDTRFPAHLPPICRLEIAALLRLLAIRFDKERMARELHVLLVASGVVHACVGIKHVNVRGTEHDRGEREDRERDKDLDQCEGGRVSPAAHPFASSSRNIGAHVHGSISITCGSPLPTRSCARNGVHVPSSKNVTDSSGCVSTSTPPISTL